MNRLSKKKKFLILFIVIVINLCIGIGFKSNEHLEWSFERCELFQNIEEFSKLGKTNFDTNPTGMGSPLIITFLSIPFYYFLHSQLLSLHLVDLMLSVFILLTTFFFLERFFGYKVAIINGLFFVSMPIYNSVLISGLKPRHIVSFLFSLLIIFLFYEIFFHKSKERKTHLFAILGFLLGFSVWVHVLILPIFLFVLFLWFIFDKKFFLSKNFIIFTIFLMAGSSLLIHYFLTNKVDLEAFRVANKGYSLLEIPADMFGRFKESMNSLIVDLSIEFIFGRYFILIVLVFSFIILILINSKTIFNLIKDIFLLKPTQILKPEIPLIFLMVLIFLISFFTNLPTLTFFVYYSLFIFASIVLIELPKKSSIKVIAFFVLISVILIGLSESISKYILTPRTIYTPFYTESCYDITGYNIASRYWKDSLSLEKNCDKMGENKYYCYRAAGNLIGQNILNLSLAKDYCQKLKFKEWCYEGLYEEIGSHLTGNLTVIKNDLLLHYHGGKWNYIFFPIDIKKQNISDLTINIDGCRQFPDEYRPFCYYGVPESWVRYNEILRKIEWNEPNNLREYMKICDLIENTLDRRYCYVGFFKKIETSTLPFVTNPEICEALGDGCDYFCYEGISKEIAFRYSNVSVAEHACQSFNTNKVFLDICYKNIGYSLANRFRYNLSQVHEYCDELNEGRESCNKGIEDFLKGFSVETRNCNLDNTIYVSGYNIVIDCNNSLMEGSHTNKETPPWSTGISIRNSKNITIRNCGVSNFTVNLLIYNSSDVVVENVTLRDGFFKNILGVSVNNIIIKNVKAYNAKGNSIEFSGDYQSDSIKITDSEIYDSGVGIKLKNVKKAEISNNHIYDTMNYSIVLEKVGTVSISNNRIKTQGLSTGISITGSNFVIDNSVIIGQQNPSIIPPWSTGIDISGTNKGILKNSEVQNYTVNIFLENSGNILMENLTLHDSYFRNFFGKSVNEIILKNITAYNAWRDNSIDFSDCCSRNIEITDSSIYNSHVGIRLKDVEKVKIKNTSIKNVTKCSVIIEVPPKEVQLENVNYDPKCKVMKI